MALHHSRVASCEVDDDDDDDFDDDEDNDDDDDDDEYENGMGRMSTTNLSPSTEYARKGCNIDRMILVGEYCLAYAWTPEEATSSFTHEEYVTLTERRCNIVLPCSVEEGKIVIATTSNDRGGGIDDGVDETDVRGPTDARDIGGTDGLPIARDASADNGANGRSVNDAPSLDLESHQSRDGAIIPDGAYSSALVPTPPGATLDALARGGSGASVAGADGDFLGRTTIDTRNRSSSHAVAANFDQPQYDFAAPPNEPSTIASTLCGVGGGVICDDNVVELMTSEKISDVGDILGPLAITPMNVAPPPFEGRDIDRRRPRPASEITPRPVSCETEAGLPCHNNMDDSRGAVNGIEVGNFNRNSPSRSPESIDPFDDIPDEEFLALEASVVNNSYCTTPEGTKDRRDNSRRRIDTGDSFDDMLDDDDVDDDEVSCARVGNEYVKINEVARVPTAQDLVSDTDCAHVPRSQHLSDSGVNTQASCLAPRGASLFDSLDVDDLDFLGEDDE